MEPRPIDVNSFAAHVALYMAENAYLNDTALDVLKKVSKWLEEEPTLDHAPVKHGEWISTGNGVYYCSKCDRRVPFALGHRYCPNCGAKMEA